MPKAETEGFPLALPVDGRALKSLIEQLGRARAPGEPSPAWAARGAAAAAPSPYARAFRAPRALGAVTPPSSGPLLCWDDDDLAAVLERAHLLGSVVAAPHAATSATPGATGAAASGAAAAGDGSERPRRPRPRRRRDLPLLLKRFLARVVLQVVMPLAINYFYSSSEM